MQATSATFCPWIIVEHNEASQEGVWAKWSCCRDEVHRYAPQHFPKTFQRYIVDWNSRPFVAEFCYTSWSLLLLVCWLWPILKSLSSSSTSICPQEPVSNVQTALGLIPFGPISLQIDAGTSIFWNRLDSDPHCDGILFFHQADKPSTSSNI